MDDEIIEHFAQQVEHFGSSDIWYSFKTVDLLPPRYKEQASLLDKGDQVFDSWFDSSLSWAFH
jgi:isoleucyl-tRNA synthetase